MAMLTVITIILPFSRNSQEIMSLSINGDDSVKEREMSTLLAFELVWEFNPLRIVAPEMVVRQFGLKSSKL